MKIFIFAIIFVLDIANAIPTDHTDYRDLPRLEVNDDNVDTFGNVTLGNDFILAKVVVREPEDGSVDEIITFPWEKMNNANIVIRGVKHKDYNADRTTQVKIIDGGIGKSFIKLRIRSRAGQGIRSSFRFYAYDSNVVQHEKESEDSANPKSIFSRFGRWFSNIWKKICDGIQKTVFTKN